MEERELQKNLIFKKNLNNIYDHRKKEHKENVVMTNIHYYYLRWYQNILRPKYNIWLSNTGILNIDNRLACFVYVIIITRKYLQWVISKDSIPQYQYLYTKYHVNTI